jgi:hypothetical protein
MLQYEATEEEAVEHAGDESDERSRNGENNAEPFQMALMRPFLGLKQCARRLPLLR